MEQMFYASGPFRLQKELTDVHMLDAVPAHVELIQGDNIFRKVIPDAAHISFPFDHDINPFERLAPV